MPFVSDKIQYDEERGMKLDTHEVALHSNLPFIFILHFEIVKTEERGIYLK
jgi:hypothetical protein